MAKDKPKEEKRFRLLKNPNQTALEQSYQLQDGSAVIVPKNGYHFSMDSAMDKHIAFLKEKHGFEEVE